MSKPQLDRRGFLGTVSAGAAAIGVSMISSPIRAAATYDFSDKPEGDPDRWFDQVKGKHRMVFDVREPVASPFPFGWPFTFLMTNKATGTPEKDCGVVVVFRHEATPYALNSAIWEKYHIGEAFKINDPLTNAPATHNPFYKAAPGTFKLPGLGEVKIGIDDLQEMGVMFCVCHASLGGMSSVFAGKMNLDPAVVAKEWINGVLPGIQIVPSGVWALGRAQEHKCAYCFAG